MKNLWIKVSTMIYTLYMVARYGLDGAEKIINREMEELKGIEVE